MIQTEGERLPETMTKVQDLLERRAEGWESDEEEAGEGLYYTEKQTRVFKAIVKNRDANLKEVAEAAGVHPSYVRYIVNRLPKDKATDLEWLMEKADVEPAELDEDVPTEEEEDGGEEGVGAVEQESVMESFNVGGGEGREASEASNAHEITMTRQLPVTITVQIPQEMLESEAVGKVEEAQRIMNQVDM